MAKDVNMESSRVGAKQVRFHVCSAPKVQLDGLNNRWIDVRLNMLCEMHDMPAARIRSGRNRVEASKRSAERREVRSQGIWCPAGLPCRAPCNANTAGHSIDEQSPTSVVPNFTAEGDGRSKCG